MDWRSKGLEQESVTHGEDGPHRHPIPVRLLFAALGSLFVLLAVLGIFLPVLPTTPFLLLAAACYLRSSHRLDSRLMGSRVLGAYLKDYYEHRRMRRRAKAVTISLLWLTIGLSCWLSGFDPVISGILLVVAVGVTMHIALLRAASLKAPATGTQPARD